MISICPNTKDCKKECSHKSAHVFLPSECSVRAECPQCMHYSPLIDGDSHCTYIGTIYGRCTPNPNINDCKRIRHGIPYCKYWKKMENSRNTNSNMNLIF